jgi:hypothetical protein
LNSSASRAPGAPPAGTPPPFVVHVDLDGWSDISRAHGWKNAQHTDTIFETGLGNFLDLVEANGLRATLFVIANSLEEPRKLELIRQAVHRGHEIACHSLTHAYLSQIDRRSKEREVVEGRKKLEDCIGVQVRGFRAPGYRIDRESVDLLGECGYEYDSSVFPTQKFSEQLKVPISDLAAPGRPFGDNPLVELPLPGHLPLPFPFNPSYALVFGLSYFRLGLSRFRKKGHPLVLLFHLIDLAEPLPREQLNGFRSRLFTLSTMRVEQKRSRCQKILNWVLADYSPMTTSALVKHYSAIPAVEAATS